MKRILYFTRSMALGGTENVILSLCKAFCNEYEITVVSCGGENVKKLEKMNIKHISIEDITSKNPLTMIKIYFKIKEILKQNFDVIHTHHRMAAFYVRLCIGKKTFIHTMHNSFEDKIKLTRYALKYSQIIACGNTVERNIRDVFNLNNVQTITNGIDNSFIDEKIDVIDEAKEQGKFVFGFVGRLSEQKGVDVLIKAFKNIENAILLIYGDGELKNELKELIIESDISDKVFIMGKTSNPLNVISKLDCMVLPSRWEGLPLNIIEAFSVKTLVLTSNITNNRELVDNDFGIVFKVDDVIDLAEKLNIIIDNYKKYENYIANAYIKYKEKYSYEVFTNLYKEKYEMLRGGIDEEDS